MTNDLRSVTAEQATLRLNEIAAHLWMIRTFLKHADEIQEDAEMLEVPRMIFDYIRALEPSTLAGDFARCVRLARGKLPKLRRVQEYFAREHRRVSDHTNFQMAALSLTACVARIEEILAAEKSTASEATIASDAEESSCT